MAVDSKRVLYWRSLWCYCCESIVPTVGKQAGYSVDHGLEFDEICSFGQEALGPDRGDSITLGSHRQLARVAWHQCHERAARGVHCEGRTKGDMVDQHMVRVDLGAQLHDLACNPLGLPQKIVLSVQRLAFYRG